METSTDPGVPSSTAMAGRLLLVNAASIKSEGGRVVLAQLMRAIAGRVSSDWQVEVIVRGAEGLPVGPRIFYRDLGARWDGWAGRFWLETAGFRRMWRGRAVDTFLSMQGANATVSARRKFVYCHNALGFAFPTVAELVESPRLAILQSAYALTYRFGIGRDATVIVQQEWQREAFARLGLRKCIVAHPLETMAPLAARRDFSMAGPLRMIYPTSPLPHKNVTMLCEALAMLDRESPGAFELLLTLDGTENDLARSLADRFSGGRGIIFAGQLSRAMLDRAYSEAHLLLFPSRVESWGLPLSEAKQHGLGILAADLPYAHETIGAYDAADFFDPDDPSALAERIRSLRMGDRPLRRVVAPSPNEPFAPDWEVLAGRILDQER